MKQDIKLYIGDRLVDFSEELSMPFTYSLKDINNPTIVKNPFTKTIDIIGTPSNNNIFGDIYNFNREQMYDATKLVGAYFNPSVRTPFSIFRNGELIESGYMQLNSITLKGKDINYNITLYGGIGNFFYSLMYSENGETLTLGDLTYGVKDSNGNVIDSENEFDFIISKTFVNDCFNNVDKDNNGTIYDYLTFAPSYNGLPENFDSDKVLINTYNNSYWKGTTSTTVDKVSYTPYNNYVLANLPRKYTEWEILDLRSYLQRPAIKMSKIIEACSKPVNNGGYNVELDTDFFNDDNPYYKDAWVALPLLSNQEKEKNNIHSSVGRLYNDDLTVGSVNGSTVTNKEDYIIPTSNFTVSSNYIDYSDIPVGTLTNVEVTLGVNFTPNSECDAETLSLTVFQRDENELVTSYSAILFQMLAYNEKNEILSYTDVYALTSIANAYVVNESNYKYNWVGYTPTVAGEKIINFKGNFKRQSTGTYRYTNYDGGDSYNIKLENIPMSEKIRIGIKMIRVNDRWGEIGYGNLSNSTSINDVSFVEGYFTPNITKMVIKRDETDNAIGTNSLITKHFLLKTEKTPADYLLGYTKLFNLFYTVDETTKTVKIQTMSNFFNGKVVDWSDKIDYSKDVKIKPLMFDKKFYCMKYEGENYYLNKYKNEYSVEYGQKRINTNYNFNAETQQLFDNAVFQNAVSVLDTSPFYHTFKDSNDYIIAPFNTEEYDYVLFNVDGANNVKKTELTYKTPTSFDAWVWSRNSGYDAFAKTCFFNLENNEKSLVDINNVLLFYNGNVKPESLDGEPIKYKLTDDLTEMYLLNDKKPCYLFTDSNITSTNETIAIERAEIPQFLRYKIVGNQIQASWDFGKPKEIYIPDTTYNDNTTLYNQFWSNYYNDQLDINTKEVTCYINLSGEVVNSELLRNFYYFNGCYWILNKIENYSINSYDTTKCTFIRVNNLSNYSNTGEV